MWARIIVIAMCITCIVCQGTKPSKPGLTVGSKPPPSPCNPPCQVPLQTCIKLSSCKGKSCHTCADTQSIRLPGSTAQDLQKQKQLAMMMQMQAMQRMAKKNSVTPAPKGNSNGFLFGMNTGNPMMDLYMTRALMDGGGLGFLGM